MEIEERETEETLFLRLKSEYEKEIKASEKRERFLNLTGDEYRKEVEEEKRGAEERRKEIIRQIIHDAVFKETSDLFLHPTPDYKDCLPPTSPIIRAIEIIDRARTFLNPKELSENKIKLKSAIAIFARGCELPFRAQYRACEGHPYFFDIERKTNEYATNIYDVSENIIVSEANTTAFYKRDELENYEIYAVLVIYLAWRVLQDSTDNKFNDPDMPVENMLRLQNATHLLFEAQKLYDKFLLEEKELSKQIATNRAYAANITKHKKNKEIYTALKNETENILKVNPKLKSHYYSIAELILKRKKDDRLKNVELRNLSLGKDRIARLLKEMSN